jgi:hypothetical protein
MSDIFDFGFTAVDEEDLHSVEISKKIAQESAATAEQLTERLDRLYNAITPLLNNLKKNPEKEYILWPNRLKKVEEFEDFIQKIYSGE